MPNSRKNFQATTHEATSEDAERRLDNFLMSTFPGVPRSRIYRIIRSGEVRVNSRRARPGQRLEVGDKVRLPPMRIAESAPGPRDAQWILDRVIYEDDHLLALDKPAGLAVHGGSGVSFGAIELLRAARPEMKSLELVHRLDRDTSGCLLVAKRRSCLRRLHEEFREGRVEKRYLALLAGKLPQERLVVDQPLNTRHRADSQRHVVVDPSGKRSVTHFTVQADYGEAILVEARIETGRTHQIRVHAAWVGSPVLGDERYGADRKALWQRYRIERLCLHASALEFHHEPTGGPLLVSAPLDGAMRSIIGRLEKRRNKLRNRKSRPTQSR